MERLGLCMLLFFSLLHPLQAQVNPAFTLGLQMDDAEYDRLPMQSRFAGSKGMEELPASVSLRKWCPKPGDQGAIGSCVGWSSCYAALTIEYARQRGLTDRTKITEQAFSAMFAYNQVKRNDVLCDGGTRIPLLLDLLSKKGTCLHREFDVRTCTRMPDDTLLMKAARHAIRDYQTLFQTADAGDLKVQKTKQSLSGGKPVIIGVEIKYNFLDIKKDDPVWHPEKGLTLFAGGHAMCVIGYDDQRQAFEIQNSWGEKWGDAGYGWIRYEDYARFCKYGFQISLPPAPQQDAELSGDFEFRVLRDREKLLFEEAPVSFQPARGFYRTKQRYWSADQLFQLLARNTAPEQYIYVLSVDSRGKGRVHFPRSAQFSTAVDGFNETPLVTIKKAEIIIPTPESALSIDEPGTDWLIVLFSGSRINDLSNLLKVLEKAAGQDDELPAALQQQLGPRLVPKDRVQYQANRMAFKGKCAAEAIVPLVLRVDSKEAEPQETEQE